MRIRFTILLAISGLVLGGFTACGNGNGGGEDVATDEGGTDEGGGLLVPQRTFTTWCGREYDPGQTARDDLCLHAGRRNI